jgi:N-acetylmuramoyl-L-alanine amidase
MMPASRTLANAILACTLALATLPGVSQTAAPVPPPAGDTSVAKTAPKPAAPPVATVPSLAAAPATPFNRGIVLLDPGHGGNDSGSRISDSILEKDVTLNLAFKLRSLLSARGFSVVMTRDSDAPTPPGGTDALTLDDRAGIANRAHPVACLLLHATAAGSGVHLYSSELDPTAGEPFANPWLTAQAPWVPQSERLQRQIGLALTRAGIPLVNSRASVRPVDSLTCPAIVVELAPQGSDSSTLNDSGYQQRVAEAIATALVFWKGQAQQPARLDPAASAPAAALGAKP